MQKITYCAIGIFFLVYCFAQDQSSVSIPPIYVTVNTTQANQTSSSSNAHATALSYAVCKQWVLQTCIAAREVSQSMWQALKDHIIQYKMRYTLYAILGSYAGLIMYVTTIERFIANQDAWHNWTDTISLEALYPLDSQVLGERLHNEIQKRYFDQHDPLNRVKPIVRFFTDIEREKKYLHYYRVIVVWLERCGVAKLPCVYVPSKESLMQAKKHLQFLEQIATEWCLYYSATDLFQGGVTKRRS